MQFCKFGCGKEGIYKQYDGTYRCSKYYQQCPAKRKETSKKSKDNHNTKEYKEKARQNAINQFKRESKQQRKDRIEKIRKSMNMPDVIDKLKKTSSAMWSDEKLKESIISNMKKTRNNEEFKKNIRIKTIQRFRNETKADKEKRCQKISKSMKKFFLNETKEENQQRRKKHKRTIERIKKKHELFYQCEEMRYNPDKPGENEIQVHCKYEGCENSKYNNGWFTPTQKQIEQRIRDIECSNLGDGSYFYCSNDCKQKCCIFNSKGDPILKDKYTIYSSLVRTFTERTIKKHGDKIHNLEKRGLENGYDLDHIFSIYDGFLNDIDPLIISHWKNLRVVKSIENRKKREKSKISLQELLLTSRDE